MSDFSKELAALRKSRTLTQAEFAGLVGLSASYIHQLEAGKKEPSDAVRKTVQFLKAQWEPDANLRAHVPGVPSSVSAQAVPKDHKCVSRLIPLVGWAHAGEAAVYEELPGSWQDTVPTECRDPKAFAVALEGDSMETRFSGGDVIVLMPSEEAYSGCFAVCRFVDDGVLLRRVEFSGVKVRLVPLNERYEAATHDRSEFAWIYPVWGRWSQLWKK